MARWLLLGIAGEPVRDPGELLEENVMSKPKPDSVYKLLS